MHCRQAAALAAASVEAVSESTEDRYRLAADFYEEPGAPDERRRYGVAELSFLRWEIERGVLNPPTGRRGGSKWWRAVNDKLLRDKIEAGLLAETSYVQASSRNVDLWLEFIRAPSPAGWYRAHNASVVAGYLEYESLAASELPVERFMINVALVRVLYAHALAAAPRMALGGFAWLGRLLGDPRRRAVAIFLDLRDQFPERYPLDGWTLDELLAGEGRWPRAMDFGLIAPRLTELYDFAAAALGEQRLTALIRNGAPCYCWLAEERAPWLGGTTRPLARAIAFATGRRPPALPTA